VKVLASMAGVAGVIALANRKKPQRASVGFLPPSTSAPTVGSWYQSKRSDLLMGKGSRSISWRVLRSLAPSLGETFADNTTRRVVVARAIVTAPQNAGLLRKAQGRQLCDGHGRTLDVRGAPLVWIPRFINDNGVIRCD